MSFIKNKPKTPTQAELKTLRKLVSLAEKAGERYIEAESDLLLKYKNASDALSSFSDFEESDPKTWEELLKRLPKLPPDF